MHVYPNYYKIFLLSFFTEYNNEWKYHKFRTKQKFKKATFTTKTKKYLI